MATKSELNWQDLDVTSLSEAQQGAYEAYKAAYRVAKAKREEFENAVRGSAQVPEGNKLVFSYNFGKLRAAVAPDTDKPKGSGKAPVSLSTLIARR